MRVLPDRPRLYCVILLSTLASLVLIDRSAALLLRPERTFFRGWEYVAGAGHYNIARKSLTHVQDEYGDLGNMLGVGRLKQWRHNAYTMDDEGYRNAHGTKRSDAPVLLVGDSFIAGVGNTDDDTFAVQLERSADRDVEPYVPGDLSLLLLEHRLSLAASGSLIVWGRVERNLTGEDSEMQAWLRTSSCPVLTERERRSREVKLWVKRLIGGVVEYVHISPLRRAGQGIFQELRFALTGGHATPVIPAEDGSDLLFFAKDVRLLGQDAAARRLTDVAQSISHARNCLAERGLRLLFVPIPDKSHIETVHVPQSLRPSIPLSPDPLDILQRELRLRGIATVDLLPAFQSATEKELLYWKDDTHWNAAGIRIATEETANVLKDMIR